MTRKLVMLAAAFLLFTCVSWAKTITGTVSDSKCGAGKHDAACVTKCVGAGEKYVVVSHGKVYQVDAQDKFKGMEGKSVKVTGDVKGDSITVASVEEAGGMMHKM